MLDFAVVGVVVLLAWVLEEILGFSAVGLALVSAVVWIYYVGATAWLMDGQTAGKVIFGLRVDRLDHGQHDDDPVRALLWSVARHTVGYVVVDVLFVGVLLAFANRQRRCLHDFAFGSVVTSEDTAALPAGAFADRYRAYWEHFSDAYDALTTRNRWFFFPWKLLSRGVVVLALVIGKFSSADAATPPVQIDHLRQTGSWAKVAIWASTSVATVGVIATVSNLRDGENAPSPPDVITTVVEDAGAGSDEGEPSTDVDGDRLIGHWRFDEAITPESGWEPEPVLEIVAGPTPALYTGGQIATEEFGGTDCPDWGDLSLDEQTIPDDARLRPPDGVGVVAAWVGSMEFPCGEEPSEPVGLVAGLLADERLLLTFFGGSGTSVVLART